MAEIIIDQTDLNLTITPNTTQLNVFTGGYACAQGNTTEFQYNNGGVLAGANGLTYNSGTQTTTAANLNVTNDANLGAVGNVTITGGNINQFLQTDGSGILSFADIANANYANHAGTVLDNAQPNITSLGNLSNLTVTGNATANFFIGNGSQLTGIGDGTQISNGTSNVRVVSANGNVAIGVNGNANILVANATGITVTRANLGSVANLNILGGNNGMVLQTDGTGNLSWTAMTGNAGNGTVGGSNTQIQYNDGGAFGGSASFTFNKTSNLMSAPGGITAVGNVQGAFLKGDGGLISNIPGGAFIANGNSIFQFANANGNATISVAGNANIVTVTGTGANISGTLDITSNLTINGNIISNSAIFANSGQVRAQFMAANTANITGNLVAGNANLGNAARANFFIGNGSLLTGLPDNTSISNGNSNVRVFSNSNVTISAAGNANILTTTGTGVNIAGTLNATGVITGNGSGLSQIAGANVTGTVTNATNATNANNATTAGSVTSASQPNITSVGTLTNLTVSGNYVTANGNVYANNGTVRGLYLQGTLTTAAQPNITEVGSLIGLTLATNADITLSGTGSNVQGANIVSANHISGNFIAGSITTASQNNITSVGSLINLTMAANADIIMSGATSNINGANIVNANFFAGSGANLSNLNASNLSTGTVPNARLSGTYTITVSGSATTAGTVTTAAQPNITSVGTLTGLTVSSTITGSVSGSAGTAGTVTTAAQPNITSFGTLTGLNVNGNITAANITANTGVFTGNGSGLSLLTGANVTGTVANATYAVSADTANSATTAGTVTTAAQPNITSVGTLTSLIVSGNITGVLANGTSNINIPTSNGNILLSVGGTANNILLSSNSCTIIGPLTVRSANTGGASGNINALNINLVSGGAGHILTTTATVVTLANVDRLDATTYVRTNATTYNTFSNIYPGYNIAGTRAFITDANTTTFNAIVGGGGTNSVPIFSDGTNWRVG